MLKSRSLFLRPCNFWRVARGAPSLTRTPLRLRPPPGCAPGGPGLHVMLSLIKGDFYSPSVVAFVSVTVARGGAEAGAGGPAAGAPTTGAHSRAPRHFPGWRPQRSPDRAGERSARAMTSGALLLLLGVLGAPLAPGKSARAPERQGQGPWPPPVPRGVTRRFPSRRPRLGSRRPAARDTFLGL